MDKKERQEQMQSLVEQWQQVHKTQQEFDGIIPENSCPITKKTKRQSLKRLATPRREVFAPPADAAHSANPR